ncbi:GNAT family N-acyltransferase [Pseudophaeobacter sp.]|uniref:GNAT family N-acetyltransferase n=1 Tax=Pseudophaeobacter sp. TaxID=1971739 RepID=UPI0032978514
MARSSSELAAFGQLRERCFHRDIQDLDGFDPQCEHILVDECASGALVGGFRIRLFQVGDTLTDSYCAQFYQLSHLAPRSSPWMELGRFCIAPERQDPDILRLAWGAVTRLVDHYQVSLLFGCSSFEGTDPELYREAFSLLQRRHLAPPDWRPQVKAPEVRRFVDLLKDRPAGQKPDLKQAQAQLPPLLRSYLVLGGCVSDHVVIDRDLNTCHVFTGLEVEAIPTARQRLLRAVADPK